MTLLFTGASGFLGNNVYPLLSLQYSVRTLGLTDNDHYKVNLVKEVPILDTRFNIVLHAAGKAHSVPKTEVEKQLFFDVNLQGTKNLCAALEKSGVPDSFIYISTVAVYGCEFGELVREEHPLNGQDPYALSKIQAEEFLTEWCNKQGVKLGIIRPSLIAGLNPPGNLGAMINGIKTGRYLRIAGGKARKSVLMVQDIANIIPLLAEQGGIYNLCDSEHPTFRNLERLICAQLGKSEPISIPYFIAKGLALVGDCLGKRAPINSNKLDKITKSLTFSNEKARKELGWEPLDVMDNFTIQ